MEAVYSALLLHKAGKPITEDAVEKVLKAAGADVDKNQVKALVAGLASKNIDEIIAQASAAPVAVAAAPAAAEPAKAAKKEEKKEEAVDTGIGGLFD